MCFDPANLRKPVFFYSTGCEVLSAVTVGRGKIEGKSKNVASDFDAWEAGTWGFWGHTPLRPSDTPALWSGLSEQRRQQFINDASGLEKSVGLNRQDLQTTQASPPTEPAYMQASEKGRMG